MRKLLWVAVVAVGTLMGTSAFADRASAPGNFGVGSELSAHYPWEEVRGTRPTFGGSAQSEFGVRYGSGAGLPGPQTSYRASREGRVQRPRPVSVRSAGDRPEALNWFDSIGRR